MPHDKNGLSIQKGDEVIVRFRVVDVFGDNKGEFCNVNLESLEPMPGSGVKTTACTGAPHIRPRIFFVAHTESERKRTGLRNCEQAAFGRFQPANGRELGNTDGIGEQAPRVNRSSGEAILGEARQEVGAGSVLSDGWRNLEWIECRDGKRRPTKPGLRVLAHGVAHRVLKLRGFGDAIVPQVAAEFVRAFTEVAP